MSVISIDLWGTLIKSSPLFVNEKIQLTQYHFRKVNGFILPHYREVKNEFNAIIESTGWMPPTEMIFRHLFNKLEGEVTEWDPNFVKSFINEYGLLADNYPPTIYSCETLEYLKLLSKKNRLVLVSNTMMIGSDYLEAILEKNGISKYFKELRFSDRIGYSKPDLAMYVKSDFHIGDNPITDSIGALNAGSIPIIINSNDKTIKDAYNIISQSK